MRASINPVATRLGQGRDIAAIGLHASAAMPIHQAVIWIRHDDLVTQRLEMLGHPFSLGRGFDHDPGVWTSPEECGRSITRRANALIDHLPARHHDSHLAFVFVQVDDTISMAGLLSCASERVFVAWSRSDHRTKEASRFIVSVSDVPRPHSTLKPHACGDHDERDREYTAQHEV